MLIVDMFNILHAAADVDPRLAGLGPVDLARLIERSRFAGEGVLLVCDGTGGGLAGAIEAVDPVGVVEGTGVRWAFAGPGRDADSLIERILERLESRGRTGGLRVVSNDKRVQAAAVGVRAKRMDAKSFLVTVVADVGRKDKGQRGTPGQQPSGRGEGLDAAGAQAWMREFGIGADGEVTKPGSPSPHDWPDDIDLDDLDTGQWLTGEPPTR